MCNNNILDPIKQATQIINTVNSFDQDKMAEALAKANQIQQQAERIIGTVTPADSNYYKIQNLKTSCESLNSLYSKQAYTTLDGRTQFISVLANFGNSSNSIIGGDNNG